MMAGRRDTGRSTEPNARSARGLLALNGALLAVLALVTLGGHLPASAGVGSNAQPVNRARGEYTMVAGEIKFGDSSGIWVVDSANQEMVAIRWNDGRNSFDGIDYRNLAEDQARRPGR